MLVKKQSIVDLSQKQFSDDEEEKKGLPWLKVIKPFIMKVDELWNKSALKGTYVIVKEGSGWWEFYLVWLTESITLWRSVGFGNYYEKVGNSY